MQTAKIQEIEGVRRHDGQNGTVYYFQLVMDNGDRGSIGKKSDTALKVGDSLTYTIETGQYGNKFKTPPPQNGFGGGGAGGSRGGTASFALSYAKDLAVANISKAEAPIDMNILAERIIATADKFQNWLKQHEN